MPGYFRPLATISAASPSPPSAPSDTEGSRSKEYSYTNFMKI